MVQLRLTVQTITPLLMYGADNKDDGINNSLRAEPEIRASSIRGILRYWLRAVIGGHTHALSKVYEAESDILGSTDNGSKISVRVQASRSMQVEPNQTVLPNRFPHTAFKPEGEFRITLATHPLYKGDVLDAKGDLLKAVFLMTHFGGLGRRARRGSGNLCVLDVNGYEGELPLAYLPENRDDLKRHLSAVSHHVCSTPIAKRPDFAVFAPDTAVVLLGRDVHVDYEDAFKELWHVSGPYHRERRIFGDVGPRRASAIHMRVAVTRQGYVAQQTIFYSGNGQWDKMRNYIMRCNAQGFQTIYGDPEGWR